jgi:ATP-dependent RNA helicase DeaD
MAEAPQRQAPSEQRSEAARRERDDGDHRERRERRTDRARDAGFKPGSKPHGERRPKFADVPSFGTKKKHEARPGRAEPSVTPWPVKGAPGKKPRKKRRG